MQYICTSPTPAAFHPSTGYTFVLRAVGTPGKSSALRMFLQMRRPGRNGKGKI